MPLTPTGVANQPRRGPFDPVFASTPAGHGLHVVMFLRLRPQEGVVFFSPWLCEPVGEPDLPSALVLSARLVPLAAVSLAGWVLPPLLSLVF